LIYSVGDNCFIRLCGINSQGTEIMAQVVPMVIHSLMNDYQRIWGEACYPVVG